MPRDGAVSSLMSLPCRLAWTAFRPQVSLPLRTTATLRVLVQVPADQAPDSTQTEPRSLLSRATPASLGDWARLCDEIARYALGFRDTQFGQGTCNVIKHRSFINELGYILETGPRQRLLPMAT